MGWRNRGVSGEGLSGAWIKSIAKFVGYFLDITTQNCISLTLCNNIIHFLLTLCYGVNVRIVSNAVYLLAIGFICCFGTITLQ